MKTLNTFQCSTKSGKPVINKLTKLPEFSKTINQRIQAVCIELGIPVKHTKKGVRPQYSHEQRWDMIRQSMPQLT